VPMAVRAPLRMTISSMVFSRISQSRAECHRGETLSLVTLRQEVRQEL